MTGNLEAMSPLEILLMVASRTAWGAREVDRWLEDKAPGSDTKKSWGGAA